MSATTKLTETARLGLDPVNPKLAQQYEQLVDLLARRLTPAHAHLFAEPAPIAVAGTGRPGFAWFAAVDGDARPVTALDPAAAGTLRESAARLVSEITAFAASLEREGEASRDLARLLRDALVVPDTDHLWSVDGQPVYVAWGYRRAGSDGPAIARGAAITASAAAVESPASPWSEPSVPLPDTAGAAASRPGPRLPPARRPWLAPILWLVFVLLCGVLADRLLRACAIGDGDWPAWMQTVLPDHCPAPSMALDPDGSAVLATIQTTDDAVRAAELALTRRALTCDASCPVPPPRRAALEAPQVIPPDLARRLTGIERGQGLELTLAWEGASDLDLQVVCPDRTRISFEHRASCGARLVADQNEKGGSSASRPVEHVIWDNAPAPEGRYGVEVGLFARHGEARPEIPFQVILSRHGEVVEQRAGRISAERVGQAVLSFDLPIAPPSQSGPQAPSGNAAVP
ncbi:MULTISPECIES: hypothetical protein [Methylobacterium]|uniref:Uncharacterized protein n=1 Tax=Methylobacterium longum TaxID=767694 RepID=A0ABT8AV59_9HYPH|nr:MULTISPECIES: hypothetical protein [Methylobacterium]MCJ2102207.1 hypothetical protein [Methylobacterium sp. E-046]MDN3573163.1 hypothetical protein [Methylobacterium longum]GJE13016.1 hypothetical protein FOHLNKBM_4075 [Methylobacterium longum]